VKETELGLVIRPVQGDLTSSVNKPSASNCLTCFWFVALSDHETSWNWNKRPWNCTESPTEFGATPASAYVLWKCWRFEALTNDNNFETSISTIDLTWLLKRTVVSNLNEVTQFSDIAIARHCEIDIRMADRHVFETENSSLDILTPRDAAGTSQRSQTHS
jgi:hypothetical protein